MNPRQRRKKKSQVNRNDANPSSIGQIRDHEHLKQAVAHHQPGRLDKAESIYGIF